MAVSFPIAESRGFNLDYCEETVLLDAWLKVRERNPAQEGWRRNFEWRFFETD